MKSSRIDIASIRREQIIEAAIAIIAEQGLQNLSLSEIEKKAGMSRGQLLYYFPTKEAILLAVFDRLLQLMCQRSHPEGKPCEEMGWWEIMQQLLPHVLAGPEANPEFHCLQYTFLAQINHREDFRQRLATLYEEWRSGMTEKLAEELAQRPARRTVSPRALSTLVQGILHGLVMQAAADPASYDREEMVALCLDVLRSYIWGDGARDASDNRRRSPRGKKARRGRAVTLLPTSESPPGGVP
jgi:AcrR family transcriptional regulator